MPNAAEPWSLTNLREKLIKLARKSKAMAATSPSNGRKSPEMFADILLLIARLRALPAPASEALVSDTTGDDGRGAPRSAPESPRVAGYHLFGGYRAASYHSFEG